MTADDGQDRTEVAKDMQGDAARLEKVDTDVLSTMFRIMVTAKMTDERFREMISSGEIQIIYYSPRGQEAIAGGIAPCLKQDDLLVTTYRGLHDQIAKGVDLRRIWAEFLGRRGGPCKGKGGPMHLTDVEKGLMLTTGIVGAGLPIANGLALAAQHKKTDQVVVCMFGDGAANIGAFHEALNLAGVWSLPVVFVCQNNRYAEHTSFNQGSSVERLSDRAAAYGMSGIQVDGNDPISVYLALGDAIERARGGSGPTLVEAMTYRFCGHVVGDEMEYIPEEELRQAIANDPVPRFRRLLMTSGRFSEPELLELEAHVQATVDDAVNFALECPPPEPSEFFQDVYAGGVS